MPSDIPVDVLLNILEYVDQEGLATMCRVNKICYSYAQDVLYREIYVKTSKVQQTLAKSTHLARKVRLFSSYFTGPNSDLPMALRNMTSLRILQLRTGINMDILDGCTFKLDSFECTYLNKHSETFPKFLSSQPSLKSLTLLSSSGASSLEATCIPNLTRIKVEYSWLPYLIPGRPLSEVVVTGSSSDGDYIDFSIFALSTTPIQKFTIDLSFLHSTPVHLLESFLPSLTHFTLKVWKKRTSFENEGFGLEVDHCIENILVAFVSLRVFTLRLNRRGHSRPPEEYLRYITKASNQTPRLESFAIHHGRGHTVRCKRFNENWVVCDVVGY